MTRKDGPSTSLVELMLEAVLGESRQPERSPHTKGAENPPPVVDRRDERGTGYKGDFPNPLGDGRRGCF